MGKSKEPFTAIWIPERPIAKQRVVVKNRVAFTPERTQLYESAIAELYDGHLYEHAIGVEVELCADGFNLYVWPEECDRISLTGDVDNYLKSILDGLNGIAWKDDKLVVDARVRKAEREIRH